MQQKRQAGLTLIELMVVVAVIGILAAVAYPAYLDQIRKANRADAQSLLMTVADRQQQFLLDTRGYADTLTSLKVAVPPTVARHYAVSVAVVAGGVPNFTVTASPLGKQAADRCGALSLTQAGAKSPANCW